jgi:hypothetical protein
MKEALVTAALGLALIVSACGGATGTTRGAAAETRMKCNLALDSADQIISSSLDFFRHSAGLLIEHQHDAFREGIRYWKNRDTSAAMTVDDTATVDGMLIDDMDLQLRSLAEGYYERAHACAPARPVVDVWEASLAL